MLSIPAGNGARALARDPPAVRTANSGSVDQSSNLRPGAPPPRGRQFWAHGLLGEMRASGFEAPRAPATVHGQPRSPHCSPHRPRWGRTPPPGLLSRASGTSHPHQAVRIPGASPIPHRQAALSCSVSSTSTSMPVACSVIAMKSPKGGTPRIYPSWNRSAMTRPSESALAFRQPGFRPWQGWPGCPDRRPDPENTTAPDACRPCQNF